MSKQTKYLVQLIITGKKATCKSSSGFHCEESLYHDSWKLKTRLRINYPFTVLRFLSSLVQHELPLTLCEAMTSVRRSFSWP